MQSPSQVYDGCVLLKCVSLFITILMMGRERITRQCEWLDLNRPAAHTLHQPKAQITLRMKTEHANTQENLWHRYRAWATISRSLSPSLPLPSSLSLFISLPRSLSLPSPCLIFFIPLASSYSSYESSAALYDTVDLTVRLVFVCLFIAPFVITGVGHISQPEGISVSDSTMYRELLRHCKMYLVK